MPGSCGGKDGTPSASPLGRSEMRIRDGEAFLCFMQVSVAWSIRNDRHSLQEPEEIP